MLGQDHLGLSGGQSAQWQSDRGAVKEAVTKCHSGRETADRLVVVWLGVGERQAAVDLKGLTTVVA